MAQDYKISFQFGEEGTSEKFQQINHGLLITGIYTSLDLSYFSVYNNAISIVKPIVLFFSPYITNGVPLNRAAKVLCSSSDESFDISGEVSYETPYIVASFDWTNWTSSATPFSISYVSRTNIVQSNPSKYISQIILGRAVFIDGLYSTIDFSESTLSKKREIELSYNMGRVVPNFDSGGEYTESVDIIFDEPIKYYRNEDYNIYGHYMIDGKKYTSSTNPITKNILSDFPSSEENQVCYIYVSDSGGGISFFKSEWFDDVSGNFYPQIDLNKKRIVLAYVRVPANSLNLSGAVIENVNSYDHKSMIPVYPHGWFKCDGKSDESVISTNLDTYLANLVDFGTVEVTDMFVDHPIADIRGNALVGSFTFSVVYKTNTRVKVSAMGIDDNSIWEGIAIWNSSTGVSSGWIWRKVLTSLDIWVE